MSVPTPDWHLDTGHGSVRADTALDTLILITAVQCGKETHVMLGATQARLLRTCLQDGRAAKEARWRLAEDVLALQGPTNRVTLPLTPELRARFAARLGALLELVDSPPAYHVERNGAWIVIADDRRRVLLATDDAGAQGLLQLARDHLRAESRDLRHPCCHERLHTLPGRDGSMVITRRDATAFMDDGVSEVQVDAHITLRTTAERLMFVRELQDVLASTVPEHARPEDALWSAR